MNSSDPFGLCTKDDRWKDCDRMISKEQGQEILNQAVLSGEWSYTYGNTKWGEPALGERAGDCKDFTYSAVSSALGNAWAGGRYNTEAFNDPSSPPKGYTGVERSAMQPGDVVVQGGHMGIVAGRRANGAVIAWQNGGSPATGPNAVGYRDSRTRGAPFSSTPGQGWFGTASVYVYRPLKQ